jgi:hypothetical protein
MNGAQLFTAHCDTDDWGTCLYQQFGSLSPVPNCKGPGAPANL